MVSENLVNSFWDLVNGFCSKQRTSYKEANAPPKVYWSIRAEFECSLLAS